jgi:hypothetical protein
MPGKAKQNTTNNDPHAHSMECSSAPTEYTFNGRKVDALQPSLQDNVTATKESSNDVCMRDDPKEGDCRSDTLNNIERKGPPEVQRRGKEEEVKQVLQDIERVEKGREGNA